MLKQRYRSLFGHEMKSQEVWDFAPFDRMIIPVEVFMYKINFISDPTKGKNEQEKVHKSCNWATAT